MAHVHTDADIDDVGVATMEFASGALGVLTGSYVSPHTFSLRLLGTEAVLELRVDLGKVWPDAERVEEVTALTVGGEVVDFTPRDMLAEQLAEFGAAIRGEGAVETGAEEGLAALGVVLDAVQASGDGGMRVSPRTSRDAHRHLVDEAPRPVLARLERADDRVVRCSRACARRVAVRASCRSSRRGRTPGRCAGAATRRRRRGSPRSRRRPRAAR